MYVFGFISINCWFFCPSEREIGRERMREKNKKNKNKSKGRVREKLESV